MNKQTRKLTLLIALTMASAVAFANPEGAQVVQGNASFTRPDANTLNITNSRNAIINWQQFNIDRGQTTRFIQPDRNSAVLNRVLSNNPSKIHGNLRSNGQVFLINQHGLMVGSGATIDTAGFYGSTLNLTDADFLNGKLNFSGGGLGGINNQGYIHAGPDGNVVLIAPDITNGGVIEVDGGNVILAAGESIRISSLNDGQIEFDVQAPDNTILNLGTIIARQGAARLFAGNLKHSGAINATGLVRNADGSISLVAQDKVEVSGSVIAQGGKIEVLGDEVNIQSGALVDTSSAGGGGEILLGGDRQGLNPAIRNAISTTVEAGAEVHADATEAGDGGKVIVFAENDVHVHGEVSARGGSQGGDGGFIETSGLKVLDITSVPDATAPAGNGGEWLIDPNDISIVAGTGNTNINATNPFATTNDSALLGVGLITTALSNGQNVTITTGALGSNLQTGTISLDTPLEIDNTTGTNTLRLDAQGDILINQPIQETVAGGGQTLHLEFIADQDIVVDNTITANSGAGTGGDITMQAGRSILVNANVSSDGGNIDLIANDFAAVDANRGAGDALLTIAPGISLDAGGGNIELSVEFGTVSATAGDMTLGNLTADHVLLRIQPAETGIDILQNPGDTITALSVFINHDFADGGTVGTLANPLSMVVDNLGAHIHGATTPPNGIYIDAQPNPSTSVVTIGETCYGNGAVGCDSYGNHLIKGLETIAGGDLVLNIADGGSGGGLTIVEPIDISDSLTIVADGNITLDPDLLSASLVLRGGLVDLTSNTGNILANGGTAAGVSGALESTRGDITVNATNLLLTEGGGLDSDAIVIVDGGANLLVLGGTACANCVTPLFFDPRGNGSSETGLADSSVTSTATWNGLGDGVSWADPLNWNIIGVPVGGGVPIGNVDVTIDPGATTTIQVSGGTRYARSLSMPGDVSIVINGASLEVGANLTVNSDLTITGTVPSPGTLDVDGTLAVGGALTLRIGSLAASGDVTVTGLTTLNSPSTSSGFQDFQIDGPGSLLANGGFDIGPNQNDDTLNLNTTLIIGGDSNWQNFGGINPISGSGSITNNATLTLANGFELPVNVDFTNGAAGTLDKSAGVGEISFNGAFNNDGIVNLNLTDLTLSGGGTHNGTFNIATNLLLDNFTLHNFNAASVLAGGGAILIENAPVVLNTSSPITPSLTVDFNAGNITSTTNLTVADFNIGTQDASSATFVDITGSLTVNGALNLQQGRLTTTGDVTVAGLTTWNPWSTSGAFQNFTLDGAGALFANGGFAIGPNQNEDSLTLDKVLIVNADSNWTDSGFYDLAGSGSIVNNALISITTSAPTFLPIGVPVLNNGEIDRLGGTIPIDFNGGLTMAVGSFLHIGTGSVTVAGGSLLLNQAELTGAGTFDGNVILVGSAIGPEQNNGSPATLTITGTLEADANSYLIFDLGGTVQGTQYDHIDVTGDVTLAGTLAVFWDSFIAASGNTFDLIETDGSFSGVFDVEYPPAGVITHAINFVGSPTNLQLDAVDVSPNIFVWNINTDGNWNDESNWTGPALRVPTTGDFAVINQPDENIIITIDGVETVAGLEAQNNLVISGIGGLTVAGNGSITGDLSTFGGSGGLSTNGNLIVASLATWSAGDMGGAGTLHFLPFGNLSIVAGAGALNVALVHDSLAGSSWSGGAVTGSGSFTNNGMLTISGSTSANYNFTNSIFGTLIKDDASSTTFNTPGTFTNNGQVQINNGALLLNQGGSHIGSFFIETSASLQLNGVHTTFGQVSGSGTVDASGGSWTSSGQIAPGGIGTIGTLSVTGNLNNLGNIFIDVQSTGVAGTAYDLLAISGQADLQGSLSLFAINAYTVTESDTITPLTFGSSISNSLIMVPIGIETPIPTYNSTSLDLLLSLLPTSTWNGGGGDTFWNTAGNWTGGVPGAGDNAIIPFGSTFTVSIAAAASAGTLSLASDASITQSAGTLTLAGNSTLSGDYNANGGTLAIGGILTLNNSTLTIAGGTLSGGTLNSIGSGSVAFGGGFNTFSGVNVDTNIDILAGQVMRVSGGLTIAATRTIRLNGGGATLRFVGPQSILGGGSIEMIGASVTDNFVDGGGGAAGTLTIGAGINIFGSGTVGTNSATFLTLNLGIITASAGNAIQNDLLTNGVGGSLVVDGGSMTLFGDWDNLGTMTVDNAGSFNLGGPFPSSALAGGGYVNLDGVSTTTISSTMNISGSFDFTDAIGDLRMISGGIFANGTLTQSQSATLLIDSTSILSQFDNVTLDMDLTIGNAATLRIFNGLTINAGRTLSLINTGGNATLQATNPQSILGSGSIVMGGVGPNNVIATNAGAGTLVIGSGISISGTGIVGTNSAGFFTRNDGTISVGTGESVTLRGVSNFGSLLASGGGSFNYNSATVDNDGVIDIGIGSSFTGASNFTNNPGGLIRGSGTFDLGGTTLANDSTLQPGGPGATGILTVLGNVTMGSTADLQIDIDDSGLVAGTDYDQLVVDGALVTATLEGALDITLLGGNPVAGTYRVIDVTSGGTLAGSFGAENLLAGFSPVNYGASFADLDYLPGALFWDDGGLDGDWNNALNWVGDVLPTLASDVSIGIFSVSIGAAANANTLSLAAGGTLTLNSGTFTLAANSTLAGDLTVGGGTLTGNGDVTVDGAFAWNGGPMTGTGVLTTTAASTINHGGTTLSKSWVNSGTLTWQAGTVTMNSTRTFTNTGIFNADGGATWILNSGAETFDNQNILNVNSNSSFGGGGAFDNSGDLVIGTGMTLSIGTGASNDSGSWTVGDGAVALTGGARTLDDGFSATSSTGSLTLSGGTLTINTTAPLVLPATLPVTVGGGGTLTSAVDLVVNGNFTWQGGPLQGAGLLTTTAASTINHGGTTLSKSWVNSGTLTWQAGTVTMNSTRTFTNTGTFNADGGATWILNSGAETFDNQNILNVNSNSSFGGGGAFDNSGDLVIGTGMTLSIGTGASNDSGSWTVGDGAVALTGGARTLDDGFSATSSTGSLTLSGGTLTINTTAPLVLPATLPVTVGGGGTLTGTGDLVVNGNFSWQGGPLQGTGLLTTAAAGNTINHGGTTLSKNWVNSGTLTWQAGNVTMNSTRTFTNTGTFNADAGAAWTLNSGAETFENQGAWFLGSNTAIAGSGPLLQTAGQLDLGGFTLTNTPALQVSGGVIGGSGSITGDLVNSGGSVEPGGAGTPGLIQVNGDYTQGLGASLLIEVDDTGTQAGVDYDQLVVNGAAVTASLDGTLDVSLLNGLPQGGIRVLDVTNGGTRIGGFATESIDAVFNAPIYGGTFVDLTLAGAITWDGPPVGGTWNTAANWSGNVVPTSADPVSIGAGFDLTIAADADADTLSLAAGSSITITAGTLTLANTSTLTGDVTINGLTAGLAVTTGNLTLNGTTLLGEGSLAVPGTITAGGPVQWNPAASLADFAITGGGDFTANGGFDIGPGTAAETLTLDRSLLVEAASTWNGDSTTITGAGAITNNSAITATNTGTATVGVGFANDGTLTKTGVGGLLSFTSGLSNNGTIDVQQGMVQATSAFTNDGTINVGFGASFDASAVSFTNNGFLTGSFGAFIAPADGTGLLNQGAVEPGGVGVVGTLNVTGDFSNASTGNIVIDIQVLGPDPLYDRLNVSGQANLDGTLSLNALGGFPGVADGDQLTPLTWLGGSTGSFASVVPIAGEIVAETYNPTDLLLTLNLGAPTFIFSNSTGNWNTATNWSSNLVPGIGDNVDLGTASVTIAAVANANTLSLAAGGQLTITGGGLTLAGNSTLDGRLILQGGTLALGGSTLTLTSRFDWSGTSTISNGTLSMTAAAAFNITAGATNTLLNATANIAALTTYSGGSLVLSNSTFNNTGNFDFQGPRLVNGVGTAVFNSQNGSTLTKSSGSGVSGFTGTTTVTSLGNVAVQSGTLNLNGATVNLDAGDVLSSGTTGTLVANVINNGGTIRPGGAGAVGQLSIQGNYTNSSGALEVEIDGVTTNDVLAVTGTTNFSAAAAASALNISYLSHVPAVNELHTIITCTVGCSSTSSFGTLNNPTGIVHTPLYNSPAGQVRLRVDSVSFGWIGASGGAWGNGANWSLGVAPDATIDVVLPALNVSINGAATANSLIVDTGGLLTINGGGNLSLASTLRVRSGATLNNSGTLAVTGLTTVNGSYTQNSGANTTLAGLTVGGAFGHNGGAATVAGAALFTGSLGVSGGTLTLSGASAAINGPFDMTAGSIQFGTGANSIGGTNNLWQGGTLRSTTGQQTLALQAGATLQLQGAATKTLRDIVLDMSLGDVNLFGSGNLVLSNAVIDNTNGLSFHSYGNGSLTGDASSQFINNGGLFENVSGVSQIAVDFINNNTSEVRVLSGSLTLLDTDLADQAAYSTALPGTLGFAAPRTLTGSLVNAGTLAAIGPTTTLTLPSGFTNTGNVALDQATLNLNGQTLTLPAGKILSGRGTIENGQVVNNGGVVLVGGAGQLGNLTLDGDYTQNAGSTMVVEVFNNGNTNQTASDTFTVTSAGNTTLNGGTLVIGFTSNSAGLVLADVSPLQLTNGVTGQFGRVIDAGGNILGFRFSGGVLTILGVTPKTPAALIDDLVGFIQNKEEIREIIESNESLAQIIGDEIARRREQEEEEDSSLICTPGA